MKRPKIQWWAACDAVACMGPFASDVEAWRALELAEASSPRAYRSTEWITRAVHAPGARVWPAVGTPVVRELNAGAR